MKFEQEKMKILTPACFFDSSVTQSVDEQLSLPDYCSDIKRILKCTLMPNINSVQITGDRISVKGDLLIRLLYVNENEKIDCCEQTSEISKNIDVKNMPENAAAIASASVEYVNCRAASQRRASVSASVSISVKVCAVSETELPCVKPSEDVQVLTRTLGAVSQAVLGEKTFDLSETVELDESKKSVGKLISQDAIALIESVKAVSGKLLVKGELKIRALYCDDSEERAFQSFSHQMPISQIVELPGLDEESTNNVRLFVKSLMLEPKADSSGSNRLIEAAAKVSAVVFSTSENQLDVISDCYCTECEMESEYKSLDFLSLAHTLEKNDSVTQTVELPCSKIGSVIDARIIKTAAAASLNEDDLEIKASASAEILFTDEEGKMQIAQRSIDFDINDSLKKKCKKIQCQPVLTVTDVKCEPDEGSKAKIILSFYVMADVFAVETEKVCTCVKPNPEKKKPEQDCTLAICYCKKGESLWEIAKKYNTVVSGIKEENGIEGDTVVGDMMIMIPCK
ncbi:MAG: SPOCS domain-containing protein [Acutalibacteraceae bacterium]